MNTTRLEAFSDGVIAIAITLLVIELHVPEHETGKLATALLHEWPQFAAYAVSFLVIGIIWINHHNMMRLLARVDRPFLFLNLGLLFSVALIPFPTAILADVLGDGGKDAHVAAAFYAGVLELMAIAFGGMWLRATTNARLLEAPIPSDIWRTASFRFLIGNAFYLIAVGAAFVNAYISLALIFLLAVYYAFDQVKTE